jgi:hypothetical protein
MHAAPPQQQRGAARRAPATAYGWPAGAAHLEALPLAGALGQPWTPALEAATTGAPGAPWAPPHAPVHNPLAAYSPEVLADMLLLDSAHAGRRAARSRAEPQGRRSTALPREAGAARARSAAARARARQAGAVASRALRGARPARHAAWHGAVPLVLPDDSS